MYSIIIIFIFLNSFSNTLASETNNNYNMLSINNSIDVGFYSNNSSFQLDKTKEFYKKLGKDINSVISPILLIIGGVGNPLCIIILLRKKKLNPTIVYLCVLAVFDLLVLYTGLLRQYLNETWNIDLRNFSFIFCKLHVFLTYTFMQISSFILVAVTLNRFTTIFNRTILCKKAKLGKRNLNRNSIRNVFIIVALISTLVSLMNLHFLLYYNLYEGRNKMSPYVNDCTILESENPTYYKFRSLYYGKLHLFIFIIIPCFILFFINLMIIKKIMSSSKQLNRNVNSITAREARKKENKRTALSVMLVSICLWFMILKMPASVYITFPVKEMSQSYFPFTYSLFMLINYTNHAVNIILYVVTSASFREEFKFFFFNRCIKKKDELAKRDEKLVVEEKKELIN